MFATSNEPKVSPRTLTHEERLALINKPFPVMRATAQPHANTHGRKAWSLAQIEHDKEGW